MSSASTIFGTKRMYAQDTFLDRVSASNISTSTVRMPQNTYMRSRHYIRTASC